MTQPKHKLPIRILAQPDDLTCGPTCLHALYGYYGDGIGLEQVIAEIPPLPEGGTLAVTLACHALRRGYRATIYTYNLQVFDPTWFDGGVDLVERLTLQKDKKRGRKLAYATDAYLEYLRLGGEVLYEHLTVDLIKGFLDHDVPVLTGLSATYLYDCARETDDGYDDVVGHAMGHFVVLNGYDHGTGEIVVSDPLHENPRYESHEYHVRGDQLIAAILLGILTYDANLLVVTPARD